MVATETHGNGFFGVASYVIYEKNTAAVNESFFQLAQPVGTHGRPFTLPTVRDHKSRPGGPGTIATPQPANSLPGLPERRLVPLQGQSKLLLQGHASAVLDIGGAAGADGLRRPSAFQNGGPKWQLDSLEVRGEYVGGTLIGTPAEMSRQAAPFRAARSDAKAPVMHYSLSLEAGDGRKTKEEWLRMARKFLKKIGFDQKRGAWFCAAHRDTKNDHLHIVFLRSYGDGTLWNREFSARRAIQATAEIEREFGLRVHDRTPKKERKAETRKEQEATKQTGKTKTKGLSVNKKEIIKQIDLATEKLHAVHPAGYSVAQLTAELKPNGVDVQAYSPKGRLAGLKYSHDGAWVSGSSLGANYSPTGLFQRGLLDPRTETPAAPVDVPDTPAMALELPKVEQAPVSEAEPLAAPAPDQAEPAHGLLAVRQAQSKQVVSTKEALGDLLDGLDASFQARLAKDANVIENEHRVAVMKKQKGLAALLVDLPRVAQAALGNFINMLMKLIEKVFLLPEGSLGRIEVPEISNTVDVPIGVVPPAPLRADADQSEARRRAAALKLADGALGRVIKAVEQREPELLPLPVSADEGMKASRFAAVQGLKVSNLEAEAPAPAHAIEASADTPEQAKARELLRRSNIFLLKDKITYLAYEGDDEGARRLERDLDELGFNEKDEQAYQAWTLSTGAKLLEGESSEHYVLRHEAEHLGYRLQLDREFGLGLNDREKTEEALARIQIELVKAELHQEREGREQQR